MTSDLFFSNDVIEIPFDKITMIDKSSTLDKITIHFEDGEYDLFGEDMTEFLEAWEGYKSRSNIERRMRLDFYKKAGVK